MKNQQGIALISVLIVVALVTTLVSLMWNRQHQNFEYTQYLQIQEEMLSDVYGAETLAKKELLDDNPKVDSNDDDWAKKGIIFSIKNAIIEPKITDLQSKLNLNNLFSISNNQITLTPEFSNCLNIINTQLEQEPMTDYLLSYLNDTNENKKLFIHLSQLNKIETIETKDKQKIKPFLIVLKDNTPININTASKEVLMCFGSEVSEFIAKDIITHRPFEDIKEFQDFLLPHFSKKQIEKIFTTKNTSVNSHYFLLETKVTLSGFKLISKTLFKRDGAKITALYRIYNKPLK